MFVFDNKYLLLVVLAYIYIYIYISLQITKKIKKMHNPYHAGLRVDTAVVGKEGTGIESRVWCHHALVTRMLDLMDSLGEGVLESESVFKKPMQKCSNTLLLSLFAARPVWHKLRAELLKSLMQPYLTHADIKAHTPDAAPVTKGPAAMVHAMCRLDLGLFLSQFDECDAEGRNVSETCIMLLSSIPHGLASLGTVSPSTFVFKTIVIAARAGKMDVAGEHGCILCEAS